ncbi:MAG: CHAD domain-containing protein [Balneolaceae bacterium]|nr:MAG: CHAD domain-containing protein [Balneolaceae bacterium]
MKTILPENGNPEPQPSVITELHFSSKDEFRQSCCAAFQDLVHLLSSYAISADQNIIESTHQIRKKLKFFRAFTKLLKPGACSVESKRVNSFLRNHGKVFSDLRDSHVRSLLLTGEFHPHLKPQSESLSEYLEKMTRSESEILEEKLLSDRQFRNFSASISSEPFLKPYFCQIDEDGHFLTESYLKSYETSGTAFEQSRQSNIPEELHEWRKRLKDVQYQLELIQSRLTEDSLRFYEQVSSLCTVLGDINDLSMLIDWLDKQDPSKLPEEDHGIYLNRIRRQSDLLVAAAFDQGKDLYSLPVSEFERIITAAVAQ